MFFLIGVVILIGFILFVYFYIKKQFQKIFGINLNDILKSIPSEETMTPRSLSSMDRIYLENLLKDFPEMNINEMKRLAEQNILDMFYAIETKDTTKLKGKLKSLAETKMNDHDDYQKIRFHNTVLSNYQKTNEIATMIIGSSFEYILNGKITQDRAKVEFIYIIDEQKINPNEKSLGLNCPNCGSPIQTLGFKQCSYCGTGIKDLVKKTWVCNDITFY